MKKILVFSAAIVSLTVAAKAQPGEATIKNDIAKINSEVSSLNHDKKTDKEELKKLEGKEPGERTKDQFYQDFGLVPVSKWERTENYDEVTFSDKGKEFTAFYDATPELVGTVSYETFEDMPAEAQKYIDRHYGDYDKLAVIYYDDNELNETDMMLFGEQFEDEDNYFIELQKGNKTIVLRSTMDGNIFFFKQIQ